MMISSNQSVMATHNYGVGENEDIREKIAAGLGAFAQHCSVEEVRQMLAGPVAAPSGQPAARMGSALIIANTAHFAPQRSALTCILPCSCCFSFCHSLLGDYLFAAIPDSGCAFTCHKSHECKNW